MIIARVPQDIWLPEQDTPRSPGVHMSGLIRAIATEQGILRPEWAEEVSLVDVRKITDLVAKLRISIGLAWEQHYIAKILGPQGVIDHPGEVVIDDIYGTPDGESVDVIITSGAGFQLIVHEIKATYKSVNTVGDLTGQWMWLAQIKAYCKAKQTRHARLHVLFLCGDYSYPISPMHQVWELEFTQEEVDDNWELLRSYRDRWLAREEYERRMASLHPSPEMDLNRRIKLARG